MVARDAVEACRKRALNPERPVMRGSHENGDIFFQHREACNKYYDAVPGIVEKYMDKVNAKLGTNYKLFEYYGAEDADRVIIAMGSICDVAEEVIDYLTAKGEKVGLVKVSLYRPFSAKHLLAAIPETANKIAVLDRTKEPGAYAEPLHLDVMSAMSEAGRKATIIGGRYGLGSKDTTPASIFAVYEELAKDAPKARFTLGINDDVTHLSLEEKEAPNTAAEGTIECKFLGLGGDGTVGANKNSIKIIGDHTNKYVQAYFQYDSKKTGGITISHLRFGDKPIKSPYYINKADFVACHNPSYVTKGYNMVRDVKQGGVCLSNKKMAEKTDWSIQAMHIKTPSQKTQIRSLSGGNQQKVIIGRWLLTSPEVLLLDEPTRGIDVGAKYEIYQLIINLANEGKGVIMVSSEMPELLGVCDRIIVMSGGQVAGEVDARTTSQEEILTLAAKYV